MKIAYVLDSFPRLSETFLVREIAAVARLHDVRIVALSRGDEEPPDPEAAALADRVDYLREPRAGTGFAPGKMLLHPVRGAKASLCAWRGRGESAWKRRAPLVAEGEALRRWGVERIHAHFARWATAAADVLSAWTGAPFGFTAHAYDVFAEPVRLREKVARASWVVACSEAARAEIERRSWAPAPRPRSGLAGKVRVIRHGVDLDRFRPGDRPRGDGSLKVLAVGRLVEKKGFDVLLAALTLLAARGVRFSARIVGGGDGAETLARAVESLGLGGHVRLEGPRSPDEVLTAYREWADVLAAPSRVTASGDRDGLPNVVGEAMACGVPVVATRVGGIPEMVEDGVTGILVPEGDAAALAEALARIADDPTLAARLGRGARERAEAVFDARANVGALLAVIAAGGAPCLGSDPKRMGPPGG